MLFAFLFGTSGSVLGAYNHSSPEVLSGNFLLWEAEVSAEWPLELADPTREMGVWVYDEALGVLVYVRQNPWTAFDPTGLFMQKFGNWLGERVPAPPTVRSMGKHTDVVVGGTQATLAVASAVPGLGKVADGLSAGISAAEGKYGEAALTLTAGKAFSLAAKGAKAGVGVLAATQTLSKAGKAAKGVSKAAAAGMKSAKNTLKEGASRIKKLLPKSGCFVAGTIILAEAGQIPIEEIEVGENVWSYHQESKTWEFREVLETYTFVYEGDVITFQVGEEEIVATGNHPIWVIAGEGLGTRPRVGSEIGTDEHGFTEAGRWVEARHLKLGDQLNLKGGQSESVVTLHNKEREVQVFNFQVEGNHNYTVSSLGILVHNADCAKNAQAPKSGTLFRGDNNFKLGNSIGNSNSSITAEAIIQHVQGKGGGVFTSFSTKLAKGAADSRGAKFFGNRAVKVDQNDLGGITQITPDNAFNIINSHSKKKIRVQAGNIRANMQRNNEVLTHGQIPANVIQSAN